MENKFSDYINNNNISEEIFDSVDNTNNNYVQSTEELINKYSQYSAEELTGEFLKMAEEKRSKGTLDSDLLRYKNVLEPYLTAEQKNRMNDLFNKVK